MLKRPNNDLIPKAKYWPHLQNCYKLKLLLQKGCEKWQMFGLILNFYYLYLSLSYCQLIFFLLLWICSVLFSVRSLFWIFMFGYNFIWCLQNTRVFKQPSFLKAANQSIQDSNILLYFIHCTYGQRTASYIMFYKFHTPKLWYCTFNT